jgi:DNA-binding NtrC family response regulator
MRNRAAKFREETTAKRPLLNSRIMKPKLLIIDDDQEIRSQMNSALCQQYDLLMAEVRPAAVAIFADQRPSVVLLDLGLSPDTSQEGLATLAEIHTRDNLAKIIIICGQAERQTGLQAIGAGAYDFLTKPINVDELKVILKRAFHVANLERDYLDLQKQVRTESFEGNLGASLKEAREAVERRLVQKALQKHNGKIARAAVELGISRPTLYELMEKLGIRRQEREETAAGH